MQIPPPSPALLELAKLAVARMEADRLRRASMPPEAVKAEDEAWARRMAAQSVEQSMRDAAANGGCDCGMKH